MKLADMRNLSSARLNKKLYEHANWNFKGLNKLNAAQVGKLLEKTNESLSKFRKTRKLYESERDPRFTSFLLAKEVLEKRLNEMDISNEVRKVSLNENDLSQAESIMAAQDIVDTLQSMLEDVGELINEKLPPLVDSVRGTIGETEAQSFSTSANEALNSLLDSVRSAREGLDNSVRRLSGEQVPDKMDMPGDESSIGDKDDGMEDFDDIEDLGDLDDAFGASDPAAGGDEPLGRPERD